MARERDPPHDHVSYKIKKQYFFSDRLDWRRRAGGTGDHH